MEKLTSRKTTSISEKICFALGNVGGCFMWSFTGSFLTVYYTDSVYLAAAFAGVMMMLARVFDGVSDILFGMVMEKTHFKWGKARPWFVICIIPLVISFLLVFSVPQGLSEGATKAYVAATYLLLTVVTYTVFNLSYWAMVPRISLDAYDRNKLSTAGSIAGTMTTVVLSVATFPLLDKFGGIHSAEAWRWTTLVYAMIALAALIFCAVGTREKIPAQAKTDETGKVEKHQLKLAFSVLLRCKYFYIAIVVCLLQALYGGVILGLSTYYAKDVLGDTNTYSFLVITYVLTTVIGMAFCPKLIQKFGKQKVMIAGSALTAIGSPIALFGPRNLPVVIVSLCIAALGASTSVGQWTFSAEIVDFLEKKIGMRVEGLTTSATSCGSKIGTGLGSAVLGIGLSIGGYAGELAVQPDSVANVLIFLFAVFPIITSILNMIAISFWDIDKVSTATNE